MVKIISKRGTSVTEADDKDNWAGEKFKKYQEEQKKKGGTIVKDRGTAATDLESTPEGTVQKPTKTVTKRGTETKEHSSNC